MDFIDLKRQYRAYRQEIDQAVSAVIQSGRFILGEEVSLLEQELAEFTGAGSAVAVSSGTDALIVALMAAEAGPGQEIITTPFTFIATAEAIALSGARPLFVDIDPKTFNMDVNRLAELLEARSRRGRMPSGIIPVSLFGLCADMDRINSLAQKHGLFVLEDACQSMGATYGKRLSCNLSSMAATSFFPSKPLGGYGDGGMAFFSDPDLAGRARCLRVHGETSRYRHEYIGLNARLDAIQAAVLRVKLRHFPNEIEARQRAADRYSSLLESFREHVAVPEVPEDYKSVFAQYTVRIKGGIRDRVAAFMNSMQVPTAVHYPVPIHLQKAFAFLGYRQGDFPEAERACQEVLSLPMHALIEESEQEQVIAAMRAALEHLKKI